jgi:ethanolamine utilization microcompartment shell protein EutL
MVMTVDHELDRITYGGEPKQPPRREAAENLRIVGKQFAADRRSEIEVTLKQMEADAAEAEKKLQKINEAGKQSWSALMTALTETRGAFDRANQAAQEAFKQTV